MPNFQLSTNNAIAHTPGNTETIQATCPGCSAKTNFITIPGVSVNDILDRRSGDNNITYGIRICPDTGCRTLIYFRREGQSNSNLFVYPPPGAIFTVKSVPLSIESDANEAILCYKVGALKATIVMCRRAVEATCDEQQASGRNLKEQIDDLHTKGLIDSRLKTWAHQIRFFGNSGAHPDPAFGSATAADADLMIDFMTTFLEYIYEMPAKIATAQARSGKV
jgi:hypothetical protein